MALFSEDQDQEAILSTSGRGEAFGDIVARRMSRRTFLKSAATASMLVIGGAVTSQTTAARPAPAAQASMPRLGFSAIQPIASTIDQIAVADQHTIDVLLRWGDPLTADAPEFNINAQTAAAQAQQFGYNCDFVGFLPLPLGAHTSDHGLLVVNQEYTDPTLMFPGYVVGAPTKEQVDIEMAAHGVSVVEIQRTGQSWGYKRASSLNVRYTATTSMTITGPAAGHDWLKTTDDPTGQAVLGTLNNCSAGKTPWGTVVTAEENFHQYFANLATLPAADPRKAIHSRYGLTTGGSERRWESFYNRFDVSKEPNEAFRFGWAVEIDPYDPTFVPKKRTALGRFRHEAQTFTVTPSGKVAVYTGDDSQFEYVYKFVSDGSYDANNRAANMRLLDSGTLYVAKFNDDGSGQWLPLVFGQGPLTLANGFSSQADVLLKTRLAADALGATKMDRPEDIETNPTNQKVYIVLTNNTRRGTTGQPGTDPSNPRAANSFGHIIELTEANNDHAAITFSWGIFLLCGNPADASTYFAGFDKTQVSTIANPDNITFDRTGNLWIATDGQPSSLKINDGLFAVPVEGPERGKLQQFFSSPAGSEVCGPEFTPDNSSLFLAIQHPGEGGTFAQPISTWPDNTNPPRPSVIVIQHASGGSVGQHATVFLPNIQRG